jgi:hypothetical protein
MGKQRQKFWYDNAGQTSQLSEVEKELHNKFIEEFLFDFDDVKAAIRCGFSAASAKQYGPQMYASAYVQRQLKEFYNEEKNAGRSDVALVKATLRNTMINGGYKEAVMAATQMKSICGMEAPAKQGLQSGHRGGIMRLPAIASLNEWEKVAESHQRNVMKEQKDETA